MHLINVHIKRQSNANGLCESQYGITILDVSPAKSKPNSVTRLIRNKISLSIKCETRPKLSYLLLSCTLILLQRIELPVTFQRFPFVGDNFRICYYFRWFSWCTVYLDWYVVSQFHSFVRFIG